VGARVRTVRTGGVDPIREGERDSSLICEISVFRWCFGEDSSLDVPFKCRSFCVQVVYWKGSH
jgi:hypothetical protein